MADIFSALAAGGVFRLESSLGPPIDIPLVNDSGEPSLAVRVLRPRITYFQNGAPVLSVAPAGEPSEGIPWGLVALAGLALLLLFFRR